MMSKARGVGRVLRLRLPDHGESRLGKTNPRGCKSFNTLCSCLCFEVRFSVPFYVIRAN